MKTAAYHKKQWRLQAIAGLILVGFGASLIAEAAILKAGDAETWQWVVAGTIALCVFNSALCLFGNGILHRVRYEKLVGE